MTDSPSTVPLIEETCFLTKDGNPATTEPLPWSFFMLSIPYPRPAWATLATTIVLLAALFFHLLGALLAGLLVHQLVHHLASRWHGVGHSRARVLAVAVMAAVVVLGITGGIVGLMAFLDKGDGLPGLSQALGDAVGRMKNDLPEWLANLIPAKDAFHHKAMDWLGSHSTSLQVMGQHTLQGVARVIVGLIIGGMLALAEERRAPEYNSLANVIRQQAGQVALAFDRVVFAQLKISLVNTALSALFVLVVLPLAGTPLPFAKTLVVLTFIFGLLPVLGNLISNTMIVLVALTVSSDLALAALIFLIVIHKLEYFLNARIVGGEINAAAWEILLAMLVMEAIAGMPGVILAPIGYAYLKAQFQPKASEQLSLPLPLSQSPSLD